MGIYKVTDPISGPLGQTTVTLEPSLRLISIRDHFRQNRRQKSHKRSNKF
jgi:hypothetical protein